MGSTPQVSRPADVKAGRGRTIRGITLVFILTSLMLTLLLEALDQTLVATAAPKIIVSLHGFDRYIWVATAYLLASTSIIPIVGKLSDQFGRKWFFVVGVVIFLLGSLLSGMAGDMNQLIIFRAIQGLGAGIGIALVFTAVGDIFPPAERSRWQGIFAGIYGFASVVGPAVGGWLSDNGPLLAGIVTDTTRWRWIFYINIPIALLALLMLLIYYPNSSPQPQSRQGERKPLSRIDWTGAFLVATATICLLLGLTWGANHTYNWASPQVIIILAAAAILYILFFIVERIAAEPILPLHLLRNQVFAADSILALILGMALIALVFYLPLYFQGVLDQSASSSGATITWFTLSVVVGSAAAGITIARVGRYQALAILSFALASVGVFLFTMMNATTSLLFTVLAMVVAGIGLGMFTPTPALVIQNGLPRSLMGAGTGAITYVRSLGQVLGPAIVGAIVNTMIGLTGPLNTARGIAGVASKTTITHALSGGFWSILVFCAFGLVVTFFLKDVPLAKEFVDDIAHDIAHSIYLLTQQDIQDAKTIPVSTQTTFTLRRYDKNLVKYAVSELNKGEPEEAINLAIDAFSSNRAIWELLLQMITNASTKYVAPHTKERAFAELKQAVQDRSKAFTHCCTALILYKWLLNGSARSTLETADMWYNLGVAYSSLPLTDQWTANADAALSCYHIALQTYTYETTPAAWAATQHNMGNVYSMIFQGDRQVHLEAAIACYQAALRVYAKGQEFAQARAATLRELDLVYAHLATSGLEGQPEIPQLLPCGHQQHSANARFCSVCGMPIVSSQMRATTPPKEVTLDADKTLKYS